MNRIKKIDVQLTSVFTLGHNDSRVLKCDSRKLLYRIIRGNACIGSSFKSDIPPTPPLHLANPSPIHLKSLNQITRLRLLPLPVLEAVEVS